MRTGLGTHPHSAAYSHLAPAAHPYLAAYPHLVSGRSFALGDVTKVRRKVSRISLATHPRMAVGLQEPPRTSPQFCRACVGRLGSDAHLRLAAAL